MSVPSELYYTKDHEWVKVEDGKATIGITDFAQHELGDITYVELPKPETTLSKGNEVATIESVKAASDVYSPITGTVDEVNESLDASPDVINTDPSGEGWICTLKDIVVDDLNTLMNAEQYEAFLKEEK
ncbi:glycine cleavage system protein GcvH [bacterium]|nr:glycine cleavage system protein GcvH [bacterium]